MLPAGRNRQQEKWYSTRETMTYGDDMMTYVHKRGREELATKVQDIVDLITG